MNYQKMKSSYCSPLGDMNAKIGKTNIIEEELVDSIGPFGTRNDRGERMYARNITSL